MESMDAFRREELAIAPSETSEPAWICLTWSGRAGDREPRSTLGHFLDAIVERATASGAALELRCQDLSSVNAATIGCIVEMIHRCHAAGLHVAVRYDKGSRWQRLTFEAMRMMIKGAPGFTVEAA